MSGTCKPDLVAVAQIAPATGVAPLEKIAYRPATAAQVMDVSKSLLWEMIGAGEIKTVKRANTTWILRSEIEAFFARLQQQAA